MTQQTNLNSENTSGPTLAAAAPSVRSCGVDALLLLLALAACYPNWFNFRVVSTGADFIFLYLPNLFFNREAWLSGVMPLWNPEVFCGAPFAAKHQAATFYPLTALAALAPNLLVGLKVFRLVHVWWFGYSMYLWLRARYGHARPAALAAALLASCGSLVPGHVDHPNVMAAIAWIPAVFWAFQALLDAAALEAGEAARRALRRQGLIFAAVFALQFLAGHPQNVFYTAFACLGYFVYRIGFGERRHWKRALTAVALAGALGLALCAVQLLPLQELSARSYRVFDDYEYATGYSMKPAYLLQMLAPFAYGDPLNGFETGENWGEFTCYIGVLSVLAILLSLTARSFWRRESVFFLALLLLILALSPGAHSPFYKAFYYVFQPIVRHLRVPSRILSIEVLAAGYLLSNALTLLGARTKIAPRWRTAAAAIVALGLLAELAWFQSRQVHQNVYRLDSVPFPGGVTGVSYDRIDDLARHAAAIFDDPGLAAARPPRDQRLLRLMPSDVEWYAQHRPDPPAGTLAPPERPLRFGFYSRTRRLMHNLNFFMQVETVMGYEEGLIPTVRFKDFAFHFHRNLYSPTPDQTLLRLLGVHTVMFQHGMNAAHRRLFSFALPAPLPGLERGQTDPIVYGGVQNPAPLFQWLSQIDPAINLPALEGRYHLERGRLKRPPGSYDTTLIHYRPAPPDKPWGLNAAPRATGTPPEFRIERPSPNRFHVKWLEPLKGPRRLWFSQATYPGWKARATLADATADARITAVNAIGYVIDCPAGARAIEVHYDPASHRTGLFLTLLTLAFLLGSCIAARQASSERNP